MHIHTISLSLYIYIYIYIYIYTYIVNMLVHSEIIYKNEAAYSTQILPTMLQRRANKTLLPPLLVTYWTIRFVQLYTGSLCLPSSRNQIKNFCCQYWNHCLSWSINRNCVSKNNFTHHYFLTTQMDHVKKTLPAWTILA